MNENFNQIYEEEKVISLSGLCFYVLKKWKWMLIVAIVFGVAACALFTMRDYQAYQQTANMTAEQELESLGVPEDQKEIVHMKIDSIANYEEVIEEYEYYYNNSIKVKLNPNGVNQGTVTYVISAEDSEDVLKAAAICEEQFFSEEVIEEMAEQLSEPTDASLLKEVIKFERSYAVDLDLGGQPGYKADMEYKIVVRHFNETDCATMLAFVEEKMKEFPQMLSNENINVNVTKISTNLEQIYDRSLAPLSKDIRTAIQEAYEGISKIKNNMKEEQQLYYDYLMEKEANAEKGTAEAADASIAQFINVKMALIGAFAGAFCVAALYVAFYLLNGRVHNEAELKSWMSTPVVSLKAGTDMMAAFVRGVITSNKTDRLYLTGSSKQLNTSVMQQLKEMLADEDCEVIVGNSILKDAKALQEAANCGYVVLFETCNVSKDKDVCEAIKRASSCGIKVLSVVLE